MWCIREDVCVIDTNNALSSDKTRLVRDTVLIDLNKELISSNRIGCTPYMSDKMAARAVRV